MLDCQDICKLKALKDIIYEAGAKLQTVEGETSLNNFPQLLRQHVQTQK